MVVRHLKKAFDVITKFLALTKLISLLESFMLSTSRSTVSSFVTEVSRFISLKQEQTFIEAGSWLLKTNKVVVSSCGLSPYVYVTYLVLELFVS